MIRLVAIALVGCALWFLWKKAKIAARPVMPIEEAAKLLNVTSDAGAEEVIAAHKRLITKVHPDAGGSAELATRVNLARDTLLRHISNLKA